MDYLSHKRVIRERNAKQQQAGGKSQLKVVLLSIWTTKYHGLY